MPIRQPVVAGRFYPAEPEALRQEVGAYLGTERGDIAPLMTMLPHAGYMFCGRIIGMTLAKVCLPETIFLLGPNHTGRGAPLSVWPEGQWFSPLGAVPVDDRLAAALVNTGTGFVPDTAAHMMEHSLEVLLPFLQVHTPGIRIVPIVVSGWEQDLRIAGKALGALIQAEQTTGRATSIVVSSDMNHFADQQTTLLKDNLALARLLELDPEGLFAVVRQHEISMCGVCPATLALHACRFLGAAQSELVGHATSGDVTGDIRQVIGYAGVRIWE